MPTIHIYQKAHGSLLTTPGDGVLFYTGDYSPRANAISGIFIDNPPTLPADSAALVWRYYADTDRYLLVHVQGSHALFPAEGRNYPFRGAYEVTMADIDTLCACGRLPIASLMAAMPRIGDFKAAAQRVESATPITIAAPTATDESRRLSDHIRTAMERGNRLAISIDVAPGSLRANGVFDDDRLATLLAAIEELPVALARYATFAFNVDERHAAVTDDVLISIFPAGSAAARAAGARPWADLVGTPAKTASANIGNLAVELLAATPGPLTTTDKMLTGMSQTIDRLRSIDAAAPLLLDGDELQLWLRLGHRLDELSIKKWGEAASVYAHLTEAQRQRFVAIFKPSATTWNVQGLEREVYEAFAFEADDRRRMRDLTFNEFFYSARHAFLFTSDEGRGYLDAHVTAALLERRIATDCKLFSDVVGLFRALPYVSLALWRKAIGDRTLQLATIDPLSAIDDLPADKQEYLHELHVKHLTERLPKTWKDYRRFLDEAQDDAFKREQVTLVSPGIFAAIIDTDLDGKRTALGKRLTPDEVRARRYNELAKIAAAMLRKKYAETPTSLADYATEAVLPALVAFCKAQLSAIIDAGSGTQPDAYAVLCVACDNMSRYGDLWRIFRRQFSFWTDDEMDDLARLAERLCDTPLFSERSTTGKNKYRNVIINIVTRLRATKDPNLKTMASNLEHKALTKRQRLFRKIMGNRPESPILHWLRAGIICALCATLGFGAAKLSERFAAKPAPALDADTMSKDSLLKDSLYKDYLRKDSLRLSAPADSDR